MNNGYGIAGMAQVMLLPVKVFDAAGQPIDRDLIALGIRWAADNGAKIINMSFGGCHF
jgi:cell wall-associated protease